MDSHEEINQFEKLNPDVSGHIFSFLDKLDHVIIPYVNKQLYRNIKIYIPNILKNTFLISYLYESKWPSLSLENLLHRATNAGLKVSYDKIYMSTVHQNYWASIERFMMSKVSNYGIIRYGPMTHVKDVNANIKKIRDNHEMKLALEAAVLSGNVQKLKTIHRSDTANCSEVCNTAASIGNLTLLIWARAPKSNMGKHVCTWNADTCAIAAKNGHVKLLKWCMENGCLWDYRVAIYAEKYNHLEILELVKDFIFNKADPTKYAVTCNDLDLLKWCLEKGYEWNSDICGYAITHGYFDSIKMVHQMGYTINPDVCVAAARYGNISIIIWAYDNHFSLDVSEILYTIAENCFQKCIIRPESEDINKIFDTKTHSIVNTYADIFVWVTTTIMNQDEYNSWITKSFKFTNDKPSVETQMFAWYFDHGGKWFYDYWKSQLWVSFILFVGEVDLLKWIYLNGKEISSNICSVIACIDRTLVPSNKLLKLLQWVVSMGFKMEPKLCTHAVIHKDYEMLRWAKDNGCEILMNDFTTWHLPRMGHLTTCVDLYVDSNFELLKWLILNGFAWDKSTKKLAFNAEMYELLLWSKQNNIKDQDKYYF